MSAPTQPLRAIAAGATPARPRELARDTATNRVGEITHVTREDGLPTEVWLRPVGGGCEWPAEPDNVQRLPHDPGCHCAGTGTVSCVFSVGNGVLVVDQACPGGTDADDR